MRDSLAQRDLPIDDMLDRYELYIYKQWLRVYMRSKMIKHNKDLLESIDDRTALPRPAAASTDEPDRVERQSRERLIVGELRAELDPVRRDLELEGCADRGRSRGSSAP